MNVRSRGLVALGLLLLASAAALGAVLADDAQAVKAAALAQAEPGQHVEVKGEPEPFYPTGSLRAWGDVLPRLGNRTYALESGPVLVLLTGDERAPGGVAVAEGTVAWSGLHPAGDGRTVVVVAVASWHEPLLR